MEKKRNYFQNNLTINRCYKFKEYIAGRATIEHSSNRSSAVVNNNSNEIRITTNPLNINYCEPEDCVPSSFSNPCHIKLPSSGVPLDNVKHQIDNATYCKSKPSIVIPGNGAPDDSDVWFVNK